MTVELQADEFVAINRAAENANGLPSRFYTSPQAMLMERDSVLATSWTCIGFVNDLDFGYARPLNLLGLPLLVLRDPKGEVRVFHNVCRHRGHKLIDKTCKLQGSLRCPYHSWTYDFDGSLRGTPHLGGLGIHELAEFDKAKRGLYPVRCAVWLDMVFVNLSGDAPSFEQYLAPLHKRWEFFVGPQGLGALQIAAAAEGRMELELKSNWKLAIENFCESYHLPWVHPGLNSYSNIADHYNIVAGDWGAGQGTRVFEFSERAGISLPRFSAWPQDQLKVAEYIALFPNVLLGLQNDHFFAMSVVPTAVDRTHETTQLYYLNQAATSSEFEPARKRMLEGWREVFLEDVSVCEGMQQGRASPAFDGGAFSPVLDTATHHFHRWVAARLPRA